MDDGNLRDWDDVLDDDDEEEFRAGDVQEAGAAPAMGVLAVSEGLRIASDEDETVLRAYVTADRRSGVRIGEYVLAPYADEETLFCRVGALEYAQAFDADDATEIHARRAMRAADIDERDYKFIAELEPVAVVVPEAEGLDRRMPDRVPRPETVVREADDDDIIKTALDIPATGVFLGHLAVSGERVETGAEPPTIDYRLRDEYGAGDPLVFRHTLVAGGTGSGKTHLAKNVLRQFLDPDRTYPVESGADREPQAAVVQFDPQDEYGQMHDDNPAATDADRRRWDREGIAFGGVDDTVAFVPDVAGASYAASHHRAEQVRFSIPFSMVKRQPYLATGGGLNENQYPALDLLLDRYFEQADSPTYAGFTDFLSDPALREELDETGRVHESTFDAVARRIRAAPGGVFDQPAKPITDLVHEFVRPGGLTVVPTYHIGSSRATETVVLALSSLLIDAKLSNDPQYDRVNETPLVLGMDEAHNFLTDADTVQAKRVISKFTEAAKQGRKERLGLFLITQDPQDIADPVFKQINTRVVLNLGDEDAIQSVNIPPTLESKVPYMQTGQMVVYSPDNSEPVELIGLPKCLTNHGRD